MKLFRLSSEYYTSDSGEKVRYIISLKNETHQQNIEISKDDFSDLLQNLSREGKIRSRWSKNIHRHFFILYFAVK